MHLGFSLNRLDIDARSLAVPTGTQLTAKMLRHGVALSAMISV